MIKTLKASVKSLQYSIHENAEPYPNIFQV